MEAAISAAPALCPQQDTFMHATMTGNGQGPPPLSSSGSSIRRTTVQPGRFTLRLYKLEQENQSLREEVAQLFAWKASVDEWMRQEFGFVEPSQSAFPESELSDAPNFAESTSGIQVQPENFSNPSFGVLKSEPASDSEDGVGALEGENGLDAQVIYSGQKKKIIEEVTLSSSDSSDVEPESPSNGIQIENSEGCNPSEGKNQPHENGRKRKHTAVLPLDDSTPSSSAPSATAGENGYLSNGLPSPKKTKVTKAVIPFLHTGSQRTQKPCEICRDRTTKESVLLTCTGCKIHVHKICYGVLHVPKGAHIFLCQLCTAGVPENSRTCRFCTTIGGAMVRLESPTSTTFCHLACALWIRGPYLHNPLTMDYVLGISSVEKRRWELSCYICKEGKGRTCCVQCSFRKCLVSFHVTCAFKRGLTMELKEISPGGEVAAYSLCPAHQDCSPRADRSRRRKTKSKTGKRR